MSRKKLEALSRELCVVQLGNTVRVAKWQDSPLFPGAMELRLSTVQDMRTFYANQLVAVRNGNNIKDVCIFDVWLKHIDSPRANGLTVDASGERFVNGALNLWRGFAVSPNGASGWERLRAHIEKVVCSGNEDAIEYCFRWLAYTLQNPVNTTGVALVLRGLKGAGKGVLGSLLVHIFGPHARHITSPAHLVGKFNAHLMNCCLLFADESFWAGDKSANGVLKGLVTEEILTFEHKGVDAIQNRNRLSIIMASNESWVVPASQDERRYCVLDVSGERCGDFEYFAALHKEIYETGGAEAFLHAMLHYQLPKGYHPRQDIPETAGLKGQKAESAVAEIQWLWGLLESGKLPGSMKAGRASLADLLAHAQRSNPGLRFLNANQLAKLLKSLGVRSSSNGHSRCWVFPPLKVARQWFLKRYQGFEGFECSENSEGWIEWSAWADESGVSMS